ncbi:hypothetical protein ENUP19_0085G0002 [Entamoeba nuttalli]|uniref:WD domain, G-beta repeat-containing protein n=2 Tax=Entamoeba nuttalli TaxID=412467 RepID=K2H5B8_ENTNP|nr:WD domain, G-beta repeat-containing protein [Entamoeba nuttalli P19]EKE42773.1 WD domain, G-beta repeat-containing protein [Entamoeba nuttalli P19]|eukprot:XP_008854893.1 WD domain, G-beta repeat-containing protein [Entamoeba nuttalli P19]
MEHIQIRLINGELPNSEPSQVFEIPEETNTKELNALVNKLNKTEEEPFPYSFYTDGIQITENIPNKGAEQVVTITYYPQAVFRCRPISRSTHTMTGHSNSILSCKFSQDSSKLGSCSGDHTVRVWDLNTCTPICTLKGHGDWVLNLDWHYGNKLLASGDKLGKVIVWELNENGTDGKQLWSYCHKNFISDIQWKPEVFGDSAIFASSSRDMSSKIYDARRGEVIRTLGGHTQGVTSVRWSGNENILYTSSRDRMINVYDMRQANPIHVLKGHSHWINSISTSTEYVLRQGGYDPLEKDKGIDGAKKRLDKIMGCGGGERLVSASDDGTLYMWMPLQSQKPVHRLVGHSSQVMSCKFSPDSRIIASTGCDKNMRIWDGFTGSCLHTYRGHVQTIYGCAWSPDSRMLVSASKDSTVKLWNVVPGCRKLMTNLPGHLDEVFSIDWSLDGSSVATASYDHTIKIWRY